MKKHAAMIAICTALLVCVAAAGCTSSTSPSPTASATANSSQAATASATPTPTPPPAHLTVLFFYEPNCPHCQALEKTASFRRLENTSKVTVTPVETYTSELSDKYNVTTVPTLILVNNGTQVGRWVAPTDASAVNARIAKLFAG